MFAIIQAGGKQYKAAKGATLKIDMVPVNVGARFEIKDVLLLHNGNEAIVGSPQVTGASVTVEVLEHCRNKKVIVFKKKLRTNYRRKIGHKQKQTKVLVVGITNPSVN
jgi:large subunit ribosomal protein L21